MRRVILFAREGGLDVRLDHGVGPLRRARSIVLAYTEKYGLRKVIVLKGNTYMVRLEQSHWRSDKNKSYPYRLRGIARGTLLCSSKLAP